MATFGVCQVIMYACACVYVCKYVYIYIYVCMYVCMYVSSVFVSLTVSSGLDAEETHDL